MASLRALECLVAVADSGSITQAAQLLHSSQPAVSHQLASLERETRTLLLRREPRGVKLTPAGRAAVADARRAIEAAASVVRSARAAGQAAGGVLRLACAQSLTVPLLAAVIRQWHRRYPEVAITLRESTAMDEALGLVDSDEVDVAVLTAPSAGRFTITPVAEEEIVLAAPSGHVLAGQSAVRLEDLEGARLVHFTPVNGLSAWLDQSFARAGVHPETVMRTSVTAAAPQLAAAGLGIAVCPVSAVSHGFPGAVRSFSPRWVRQLVAVTSAEPDPLVARFIGDLRSRGMRVPHSVRTQLAQDGPPAETPRPSS
ncbi:LysR family transcriptional regulator [Streptomyces sp. NBC_01795]|uniref:LysR family transcriptional regulator n=1 Tax=unclassified Streptomyces TaxID=2593676 RepID=UPI002DDAD3DF|nr:MULTISPECIES: LysR family transcriptional regulator [unclassified Streptomyces]WSA90695.1 LysR family transcriptional regulator [Streptomyces sp. NBC_01795]WSS16701.1 LysR family transcriptional regulator [Streptomyces sp. NBC_01186]